MKTVLVTGGAGFIGSNLVGELLNKDHRVICLDNFDPLYDPKFKEDNLLNFSKNKNFTLYKTDIRDFESLKSIFEKEKPELVVHLAARPDTRDAVKSPNEYISVNINGTINVLELCKDFEIKNLVLASSSSVYGNDPNLPWSENSPADRPLSPYGATKKTTELLAHSYNHNFGLNVTCLRYFNAYGENNRPTMVPYIWADAILHNKEIEISGDGSRSRDYTYISDVVSATIMAMEKPLGFEILNVGNSDPVSLIELLAVFEKVIGVKAKVKSRPSHKASVESTFANITKVRTVLGWEPTTNIEEGITKLVTWFKANRL